MSSHDDDQALADYQQRLIQARRDALWRQVEEHKRRKRAAREQQPTAITWWLVAGLVACFALGFMVGQVVEWGLGGGR